MSVDFDRPVTADDVEELFQLILGRPVGNDSFKQAMQKSGISIREHARGLLVSQEFRSRFGRDYSENDHKVIPIPEFRVPRDLQQQADPVRKILLIGSCLMNSWEDSISAYNGTLGVGVEVEKLTINNASGLPRIDAAAAAEYDFQIIQIPLRAVLGEHLYFGLRYDDTQGYERLFEHVCQNIEANLVAALQYSIEFGTPAFVLNFLTPQQNPMGRLLPRYCLQNMVYFIEEMNRHLAQLCARYPGVHVLDFEQIVSNFGKRHFQEDSVYHFAHGGALVEFGMPGDENRLEPLGSINDLYAPTVGRIAQAVYRECVGMWRTIRQTDSVKIVIFDLDDTLWRGVAAEHEEAGSFLVEGWPLGIVEAVSYLWRRGVLVALVSKNEQENVERIWNAIYQMRFPLENFAVRKINWHPKAQNVAEILQAVNLLPRNALFVDDNPVERAGIRREFPDIRVMDAPLAHWKRILMWSPETQPAVMTAESNARTEMIQAQVVRESAKVSMGREGFLESLDLQIELSIVREASDKRYDRCFELLNKTNQYNTTGKRWTPAEMQSFFTSGAVIVAAEVKDRYTGYGIVALALVQGDTIEQFVMSCRVFGMNVENAVLARVVRAMRRQGGSRRVAAGLVQTEKNKLCMDFYKDAGFKEIEPGMWVLPSKRGMALPAHVKIGALAFSEQPAHAGAVS